VDSLFALMTLKAAGFTNVKNVRNGMFAWLDLGMPVEEDPLLVNMPPAQSPTEQDVLVRFGYDPSTGAPGAKEKVKC
jgi:3-mercaptopyruvate sulfurtransferase SseA